MHFSSSIQTRTSWCLGTTEVLVFYKPTKFISLIISDKNILESHLWELVSRTGGPMRPIWGWGSWGGCRYWWPILGGKVEIKIFFRDHIELIKAAC